MADVLHSRVVALDGSPHQRGRGQASAAPEMGGAVCAAVGFRLGEARAAGYIGERGSAYLAQQVAVNEQYAPASMREMEGIAEGFGIGREELFAYLHLGVLTDLAIRPAADPDGCSAWAASDGADGPLVVKNRDFRGEHRGLQRVFRHRDPAWGGRAVLCVGSLGSPGAYSSGMNSDGLALVDTAVGTRDHGVGVLRYFVMSEVLAGARTVGEALAMIRRLPHAGGGTMVLGDAAGAVAAVELGHRTVAIEAAGEGFVTRTNHFVSPELGSTTLAAREPMFESSKARRAHLLSALGERAAPGLAGASIVCARELMARHGGPGGLCRHGEDGDASTISSAVFACRTRRLYLAPSNPCTADWEVFDVEG